MPIGCIKGTECTPNFVTKEKWSTTAVVYYRRNLRILDFLVLASHPTTLLIPAKVTNLDFVSVEQLFESKCMGFIAVKQMSSRMAFWKLKVNRLYEDFISWSQICCKVFLKLKIINAQLKTLNQHFNSRPLWCYECV